MILVIQVQHQQMLHYNLEQHYLLLKSFINENYDGTYNEDEMVETAIKGYVEGLGDKYSEYITKEEYKEFYTNYVSGEYCGVGIYVGVDTEADKVLVVAPMPGGSAQKLE